MRTLIIQHGAQVPMAIEGFERAIGDTPSAYGKISPATETRTDILQIDAFPIHNFGAVLVDLEGVNWKQEEGPNGTYFFAEAGNLIVHYTSDRKPASSRSVRVVAELRVRTSHPINRAVGSKAPRVSYTMVLELTPAADDVIIKSRLILENSSTWDKPMLDTARQIFAAYNACLKVVVEATANVQPRGNGGQRDGRGGHQGGRGGGRHGGGQANRW